MPSKKRKRTGAKEEAEDVYIALGAPLAHSPPSGANSETLISSDSPAPSVAMALNLDPDLSPGWCAIDSALSSLYPGAAAVHFPAPVPYALGGQDPLNAVSAYDVSPVLNSITPTDTKKSGKGRASATSKAGNDAIVETQLLDRHWHFVTYGFSELFAKSPDNPAEVSGYGFELSIRVACNDTSEKPRPLSLWPYSVRGCDHPSIDRCPVWVVELLQQLARYVFTTGAQFSAGHHMTLNGALGAGPSNSTAIDSQNNITAIVFQLDPLLNPINTPNGMVNFLQVVGLTQDEYEMAWQTSPNYVASMIRQKSSPLLLTRLVRPSFFSEPAHRKLALSYASTQGSALESLYNSQIAWSLDSSATQERPMLRVSLGASIVPQFLAILKGRVPHNRSFTCVGTSAQSSCAIVFKPFVSDNQEPPSKRGKSASANSSREFSSKPTTTWALSPENPSIINVSISDAEVNQIAAKLRPLEGEYAIGPLFFVVSPTLIKDAQTSAPVRVVGRIGS